MEEWRNKGIKVDLCTVGKKANDFFQRIGANVVAHVSHLGDRPDPDIIIGIVKIMLDAYAERRIDQLFLAHNVFVNRLIQKPQVLQLIPAPANAGDDSSKRYWDYLYEPGSKELLNMLLDRYLISLVYRGVVENFACEMAARMIAMKNASDNADKSLDELRLAYQKARQAAITKEVAEIVAGAAAV